MIVVVASALGAVAAAIGTRALLPTLSTSALQSTSAQIRADVLREQPDRTTKIVPAKAEGPAHGFFFGTGDGGNGFYVK